MSDSSPAKRSSSRTRKAVARFDPISKNAYAKMQRDEEAAAKVYEPGENDTPLGSIDEIVKAISKHGSNDEVLILLHRALYGRDGKATTRKAGIRKWFGTQEEAEKERLIRSLNSSKWTTALLGEVCTILCLDKSGVKSTVIDRVASMLLHPVPDHEDKKLPVTKTPKKKKKATKKRKKKVKKAGPKRTPSSYFLWLAAEGRAAAKAEHPEASVTEISRFAGALWRELSDEEKQPYVDEAAELKAAAASKAPAAKSRKRKASATPSAPKSKKSAKSRLKDAKELLDEGLIEQEEYDDLKANILKSLRT